MIKEVIVVEGKDDVSAIKRAIKDAEVIITNGFGLTDHTINKIRIAKDKQGVIIFTDPDYAGERIRRYITERVPGCKHAYLPRRYSIKDNNIGIENAEPVHILKALKDVKTECEYIENFTFNDLIEAGLVSGNNAKERRNLLGEYLGIGYSNAKQFLRKLNHYGIPMSDFVSAMKNID